jgi:FkbM family methyltransferase
MNEHAPSVAFTAGGKQVTLRFASAQDHIARTMAATGDFYEAELLADVRSRLFFPECAVDVGAHVGNHTLYFSMVLGIKTIAFEPNAVTFELLEANVRENGVESMCRLRHAAIGASAGRVRAIASSERNSGMARVESDAAGDVPLLYLDAELQNDVRIDVIKIDVEGWELDVLRGAARVIETHRPLIYVEASDATYPEVKAFLTEHRYVCWRRFNATPTFLFMPHERLGLTRIRTSDMPIDAQH